MNINFFIFLGIIIACYYFLSNLLVYFWHNYQTPIMILGIIIIFSIMYFRPEFYNKIVSEAIIYNKLPQPPISNYHFDTNPVYNQNNVYIENVSDLKKKVILDRQNYHCYQCKQFLQSGYYIDYLIPLEQGGNYENDNLVAICQNCYNTKPK